ncbi:Bromo adjacent homology (BAH) domain [Macleaya cordata]|uniref:Bromo adjacent homology (BAH) domain n=1 Tax=Macleaya cordata TaxID=56857 RepID=A0A200QCT9_MACCD|nr:Bromo adjacent homology (BAH) domain [Macleaya cordata]
MKSTEEELEINEDEDEENAMQEDIKPTVAGKEKHYNAFEHEGDFYQLEDTVLLAPENANQKPDVAIIKKITEKKDGEMMLTCQLLYRPEEAEKKKGGRWKASDSRELFYSFKREEVPAASLMYKCVVHFIPLHKQLPVRSQHPGFIVQRVYAYKEKMLWKITDKDYVDDKQREIDLLLQKTQERLELPDSETEEAALDDLEHHQSKKKKLDVSRNLVNPTTRSGHHLTVERTQRSHTDEASEFYTILETFSALTRDTTRNKWLVQLLQKIQYVCDYSEDSNRKQVERKDGAAGLSRERRNKTKYSPAAAVSAIVALEQASHGTLSNDFKSYNQKMRQLCFNLENSERLARRLVTQELEASVILKMLPSELKEGRLTTEETATRKEPAEEEPEHIQMTDHRCSRCMEKRVGLKDIIQAGSGERYQLECIECGNTWYASSR